MISALLQAVCSTLGEVGPSQYSISIVGLVKFTNISDVPTEYLSRTSVGMLHLCKGFCDHEVLNPPLLYDLAMVGDSRPFACGLPFALYDSQNCIWPQIDLLQ